jgi:hypothetical protein
VFSVPPPSVLPLQRRDITRLVAAWSLNLIAARGLKLVPARRLDLLRTWGLDLIVRPRQYRRRCDEQPCEND